jgi:hypothetical protein
MMLTCPFLSVLQMNSTIFSSLAPSPISLT